MKLFGLFLWAVVAMGAEVEDASLCIHRGMERFRQGDIAGSLEQYSQAIERDPRIEPYLWQRGISQYYAGQFAAGRRQFELHQVVNPNDVENAAWHFLCIARVDGIEAARKRLIDLDAARDTRAPMAEIYAFYQGKATKKQVLYAELYLGLYHEAAGDEESARSHIRKAAAAELQEVYMHDVARVHLRRRRWQP